MFGDTHCKYFAETLAAFQSKSIQAYMSSGRAVKIVCMIQTCNFVSFRVVYSTTTI